MEGYIGWEKFLLQKILIDKNILIDRIYIKESKNISAKIVWFHKARIKIKMKWRSRCMI